MRDTREEHYFRVFFPFIRAFPPEVPPSFVFLRRSELREPCEILTRETIYIRLFLFPFIQVSSPRAYLAPRVLHSLSSARLKLLKMRP